jgi:hypothetical protein
VGPLPEAPLTPAELATVLQAGHAGDAALSALVLQAIGWQWEPFGCPGNGLWRTPSGSIHSGPLPLVTERAEAARALLPEHIFVATSQSPSGRWTVALFADPLLTEVDYRNAIVSTGGHTLALALCSATILLKGR